MAATLRFFDSTSTVVDNSKLTITGFDSREAGVKLVTVSYDRQSASFSVRVR